MKLLKLLYPQTCYFCGKICKKPLCDECNNKIQYVKNPRCKRCGKPIRYAEQEYCYDCQSKEVYYECGRSIWLHREPVTKSVYQFKYHNRRVYAEFYAEEMCRLFAEKVKEWGVEVIIPVPLHWKRRRVRGYNQAEVLAKQVGKRLDIPVNCKAVRRIRYTRPQKELNDKERQKNLKQAFCVTKYWKKEKSVLVIDDIYTTGNTIDAVAKVLRENGAEKIWFLTISIGQGF